MTHPHIPAWMLRPLLLNSQNYDAISRRSRDGGRVERVRIFASLTRWQAAGGRWRSADGDYFTPLHTRAADSCWEAGDGAEMKPIWLAMIAIDPGLAAAVLATARHHDPATLAAASASNATSAAPAASI